MTYEINDTSHTWQLLSGQWIVLLLLTVKIVMLEIVAPVINIDFNVIA